MYKVRRSAIWGAALLLLFSGSALGGAGFTILGQFNGDNGATPGGPLLVDCSGNLLGAAASGGTNNLGTIFQWSPTSQSIVRLASMDATTGSSPVTGLWRDPSGVIYGAALHGGPGNNGTIFRFDPGMSAVAPIASFDGTTNGSNPIGGLVFDPAGNIYGTAAGGGSAFGGGTVFQVSPSTHTVTALAAFSRTGTTYPQGLIADANGNLYGTTLFGGTQTGGFGGSVFEIDAATHTLTTLHRFSSDGDGDGPSADGLILDRAGNIFGVTTYSFGTPGSVLFEIAAGTHAYSIVGYFTGNKGAPMDPNGDLVMDAAGNIFGTSQKGGRWGFGTIFEIAADTHEISTLLSFDINSYVTSGLTADANGNLYGVGRFDSAFQGGIFEVTGSGFVVPEPHMFAVVMFAVPTLLSRRRRRSWKKSA